MASTSNPGVRASIVTTANITARRFIGLTGAHCGAGAQAYGVSHYDVDSGQTATCTINGIEIVEAGGSFSAGAHLKSDGSGKAVATTVTDNQRPADSLGIALDASTADGQFVRIKLH